ncbi:MAG: hypothetical protein AABX38_00855 [Candidatus Micrarchaeota archaeon]
MIDSFLREKPCRVLVTLRDQNIDWYLSKLAKSANVTYVFIANFIPKLEKDGIVTTEIIGKKRIIKLTEKGKYLASLIEDIRKKLIE